MLTKMKTKTQIVLLGSALLASSSGAGNRLSTTHSTVVDGPGNTTWVHRGVEKSALPAGVVRVAKDAIVCRIEQDGEWLPGEHDGHRCYAVGRTDEELIVSGPESELLIGSASVRWQPAGRSSRPPRDAIRGSLTSSNPQFICRVTSGKANHVGRIDATGRRCLWVSGANSVRLSPPLEFDYLLPLSPRSTPKSIANALPSAAQR